jgi:hypothetical protein
MMAKPTISAVWHARKGSKDTQQNSQNKPTHKQATYSKVSQKSQNHL